MRPAGFLALTFASALLCGCGGDGRGRDAARIAEAGAAGAASGYNLLLITVDTLRADRLGCYGFAGAETPVIDRLAASGVLFEQATAPAPITLPSHASILTGLDVPDHGVRHNIGFTLSEDRTTLAEVLRAQGYATAAVVGSYVLDGRFGLAQGFDEYDDDLTSGRREDAIGAGYLERTADQVVDAATAWLDGHAGDAGGPFFLWTHLFDPHAPYAPPADYRKLFTAGLIGAYDGEVAFVDAQLGRLLDRLRDLGVLERTLVVFASDHGEALGEHDEATHGTLIYESTMRVPLIVSNPRLFPRALRADDRVVGLVDLFPTLLDLLGVDRSGYRVDGVNAFAPADPDRAVHVESLLPLLDFGWSPLHGLRLEGRKYILAPTPEYYDLHEDPGERRNLYGSSKEARELASRLERKLEAWPADLDLLRAESEPPGEEIRRLAALGYVRMREGEPELGVRDPKTMMDVANRIQKAGQLSAAGKNEEALKEVESAIAEDPTSGKAWYMATRIHHRMGRYAEAEACLNYALALSPRADGYITLAQYAFSRGDVKAFDKALDEAQRLDPGEAGVHLGRGRGLAALGHFEEALAEFETVLRLDPARYGEQAREQIDKVRARLAGRR